MAQQVPALDTADIRTTYMPTGYVSRSYGPLPVLSEDTVKLTPKEQKAVSLSNQWKNRPTMPAPGENGAVNFAFGATLPSVVCAPLYACDVALQPGEIVNQVDVGDAPRWKVSPATSGSGESAITHLIIKPADVGLSSNMIVNTNRRTYSIRLVSKKEGWMPLITFSYPDDANAAWAAYHQAHAPEAALKGNVSRQDSLTQDDLDFNYRLKGDNPRWKPVRVYASSSKTFIQFPASAQNADIPALVVLGPGHQDQLVNYRLIGNRYVVDQVIDRAALISGVGRHQTRVDIEREGG
jgi:type IV secretion system protein VirB9